MAAKLQNRINMAATLALAALPLGPRISLSIPFIIPFSIAHQWSESHLLYGYAGTPSVAMASTSFYSVGHSSRRSILHGYDAVIRQFQKGP